MRRNYNLNIITTPLAPEVKGLSMQPEGKKEITIVINSSLPENEQTASFLHECLHLWHDDHSSNKDLDEIETARHKETIELLEILKQRD